MVSTIKKKIYREFFEFSPGEKSNSYVDIVCDSDIHKVGVIVGMYLEDGILAPDGVIEGTRSQILSRAFVIADNLETYDKTYEPRVVYEKVEVPVEVEKEVEICINFYAEGLIDYLYNWYCEFKGREFNEECENEK